MSKSSAVAIVELSRSKARYQEQNLLLNGFVGRDGFTAKEVAYEVLGWIKESYGNAPKRAHDLYLRGYLEQLEQKLCRQSGKEAHSYRVTAKGMEHLRELGFSLPVSVGSPVATVGSGATSRPDFSELKKYLG
jgi:hypothetical protein